MATILRVDTPQHLRDLDAQLGRPTVLGRIALSVFMALASPVVLVFALISLNPLGVLASVGWFFLWTGWIIRIWHKLKPARPYRVPVRVGVGEIREAHDIYNRLTPESTGHALPLILTMYRISGIEVQGAGGELRLVNLMRERTTALRNLLDAEDEVRLAVAMPAVQDRDDLDSAKAWRAALAEVDAMLTYRL